MIDYDETSSDVYVSGCFMMIARPAFRKVRFDESRMNRQRDDVDFRHRGADAGFTFGIVPEATAIHYLDPAGRSDADPASGPGAYAVGIYLFRMRRYREAELLLARGEDPADPFPARYHRGLVRKEMGGRSEARRRFATTLAGLPAHREAAGRLAVLGQG